MRLAFASAMLVAALTPAALVSGHRYLLAVASVDGRFEPVAFASTPFGQP